MLKGAVGKYILFVTVVSKLLFVSSCSIPSLPSHCLHAHLTGEVTAKSHLAVRHSLDPQANTLNHPRLLGRRLVFTSTGSVGFSDGAEELALTQTTLSATIRGSEIVLLRLVRRRTRLATRRFGRARGSRSRLRCRARRRRHCLKPKRCRLIPGRACV
jgi:hypothetical protein